MAQSYVDHGVNSTKVSGTSISVNDKKMDLGSTALIAIVYDNSAGPPTSVKYGKRDCDELIKKANAGTGFTVGFWVARYLRHSTTRDTVATWSSNIGVKIMRVIEVKEGSIIDVSNTREIDATTSPATGAAQTTTVANTIHFAAYMINGPNNDPVATAGSGHTLLTVGGSNPGTTGVPPISNCTMYVSSETLTATGDCRGSLTLTTARDIAAVIVALKPKQTYTIKEVTQHHRDMNQKPDYVYTQIEDEAGNRFWDDGIDPVDFDAMTDAEYYDYVKRFGSLWTHRFIDDGSNIDTDVARDTRMAGFVNDTVLI